MMVIWFIPLILFSALSLWLSMKIRGTLFTVVLISLWLTTSLTIVSNPVWLESILSMNNSLRATLVLIGLILFGFQIRQLTKKYSIYDGEDIYELSY